jgi:hypothetical protein
MKAISASAGSHAVIAKYRDHAGQVVETGWAEMDHHAVAAGRPWRTFPWYLGQRNYSGRYWSATERALVGYESLLELSRLILADFDCDVKRIASHASAAICTRTRARRRQGRVSLRRNGFKAPRASRGAGLPGVPAAAGCAYRAAVVPAASEPMAAPREDQRRSGSGRPDGTWVGSARWWPPVANRTSRRSSASRSVPADRQTSPVRSSRRSCTSCDWSTSPQPRPRTPVSSRLTTSACGSINARATLI